MEDPTISDDIRTLIRDGVTPDTLAKCGSLNELINSGKGISPTARARLLEEILWSTASRVRQKAFEQYNMGNPAGRPISQAAAMAELLGLAEVDFESKFIKVWNLAWEQGSDLSDKSRRSVPPCNSKRLEHRQLRAVAWLGFKSARQVQKDRYGPYMLEAFANELLPDLDYNDPAVRTHLTARLHELSAARANEEAETNSHASSHRADPQASHPRLILNQQLQQAVHDFAQYMTDQLVAERSANRVSDPMPIRLRWDVPKTSELIDHPEVVSHHFGVPEGSEVHLPPTVEGMAQFFQGVPSGRLVLLGAEGSGKTTLATDLSLKILELRRLSDPVPVIFNLASWDTKEPLDRWAIGQMLQNHPPSKALISRKKALAAQLIESRLVLPIFDGLDEIAKPVRHQAIPKLNNWLSRFPKAVVTSRPQEYRDAVRSKRGDVLTGALVVEIEPLGIEEVLHYLPLSARPEGDGQRTTAWDPVIEFMEKPPKGKESHRDVLCGVFKTPLMVMLARVIYSDPPRADPAELLNHGKFSNEEEVKNHLLDSFVSARFEKYALLDKSWSPADVQRFLGFLATLLVSKRTIDFAWWRLGIDLLFGRLLALTMLLMVVSGAGELIAAQVVHSIGLELAFLPLLLLAAIMLISISGIEAKPKAVNWGELGRALRGLHKEEQPLRFLAATLQPENMFYTMLVVAGLIGMVSLSQGTPLVPVAFAMGVPLCFSAFFSTPHSFTDRISPRSLLQLDKAASLARTWLYGAIAVPLCGLTLALDRTVNGFWLLAIVLLFGGLTPMTSAWGMWLTSCLTCAQSGVLPLRCMRFLEVAHDRMVLRQSGGMYQFRSIELRDRLARQFVEPLPDGWIGRSKIVATARRELKLNVKDNRNSA